MPENGMKLFSDLNLAIHVYDFRKCGEFFYFFSKKIMKYLLNN